MIPPPVQQQGEPMLQPTTSPKVTPMALKRELAVYEKQLEDFNRKHPGKYVLIHGTAVVGFFSTYEHALNRGYKEFGLQPFFIKHIQPSGQSPVIVRLALADA
jgi:hypothetical protein